MEDFDVYTNNKIKVCDYCHSIIEEKETYLTTDGKHYHLDCWKQMNTYFDGLFLEEE